MPLSVDHNVALAYGPTPRGAIIVLKAGTPRARRAARSTRCSPSASHPPPDAAPGRGRGSWGMLGWRTGRCAFAAFDGAWQGGWDAASAGITAGWDGHPRYLPEDRARGLPGGRDRPPAAGCRGERQRRCVLLAKPPGELSRGARPSGDRSRPRRHPVAGGDVRRSGGTGARGVQGSNAAGEEERRLSRTSTRRGPVTSTSSTRAEWFCARARRRIPRRFPPRAPGHELRPPQPLEAARGVGHGRLAPRARPRGAARLPAPATELSRQGESATRRAFPVDTSQSTTPASNVAMTRSAPRTARPVAYTRSGHAGVSAARPAFPVAAHDAEPPREDVEPALFVERGSVERGERQIPAEVYCHVLFAGDSPGTLDLRDHLPPGHVEPAHGAHDPAQVGRAPSAHAAPSGPATRSVTGILHRIPGPMRLSPGRATPATSPHPPAANPRTRRSGRSRTWCVLCLGTQRPPAWP